MQLSDLARAVRAFADELDHIDAEQRQARHDWIDQTKSALGAKRHCQAVRRLLQTGEPGAARIARRHLLSAAAYEAELQRVSSKPRKSKAKAEPEAESVGDELRRELRIVGGAR